MKSTTSKVQGTRLVGDLRLEVIADHPEPPKAAWPSWVKDLLVRVLLSALANEVWEVWSWLLGNLNLLRRRLFERSQVRDCRSHDPGIVVAA